MRLIAFYLPQYHPIPENDRWWGKGFTEWANVTKAQPLFEGHYQPHLPTDLGFYDLRLDEVREEQAQLARAYGVYGFCYYYYWFHGRKLLERPLDCLLKNKSLDFPFCVCWANEPWTRNWDGKPSEILLPQEHTPESDKQFILDLLPVIQDERYIKIHGRPLLLIYRTELIPHIAETALTWRHTAAQSGIDLFLCRVESFSMCDPASIHFDAACEFPPNHLGMTPETDVRLHFLGPNAHQFPGKIYEYPKLVSLLRHRAQAPYPRFLGATPSWDNTPRSGERASVFINSSPAAFRVMLTNAVRQTAERFQGDEQVVFINAWNEWGEGCHLEPDRRYGHAFLEACQSSLARTPKTLAPARSETWESYVPPQAQKA